ncbi:phage major capsid protein [Pediococcus ethanolidurans]|uniref:phage major capsid protein n=1 Tax=Pediococcus ethanolidurans TaxID=319653 RepID=UPI001C1EC48A|nr:phage major capsid protein [Pediococcus ethanolidurans]MBU7563065.1 phage major capsid protein [Pediococcus ethanolidurans]
MKEKRFTTKAELRADEPTDNETADTSTDNTDTDTNDDSKGKTLSGYAVVFNSPSKDLGGFTEVVSPKAFDGVDLSNVLMLANHDYSQVLASVKAGTLKLAVDDKGLHFDAILPNTSFANDVYEEVSSGNVDSASFSFAVAQDGDTFTKDDSGKVVRTINSVKSLFDVSVVAVPAYDSTSVAVDSRSYEKFMNQTKEENTNMEKTIIDNTKEKTETRSFENYIRSEGEQRDGLTTEGNTAVVPSEVVTPIFEYKQNDANLGRFATVKTVSAPSGVYPISTNSNAILATKDELATIADVDAGITGVNFKVATRAGKIFISQEIADDSEVPIVSEVQGQLQKLVNNTDNTNIVALLKKITKTPITSVDDIKKAFNVDLDPALNKIIITNQGGYNYLDQLKDSEGRYMLQTDPTAPTGSALLGAPIVVVPSTLLPDETDGSFPLFVGDLSQYLAIFKRNQVTTNWQQFDSYSQGLAVVVRNCYSVIDDKAMVYLTLAPATTPAK